MLHFMLPGYACLKCTWGSQPLSSFLPLCETLRCALDWRFREFKPHLLLKPNSCNVVSVRLCTQMNHWQIIGVPGFPFIDPLNYKPQSHQVNGTLTTNSGTPRTQPRVLHRGIVCHPANLSPLGGSFATCGGNLEKLKVPHLWGLVRVSGRTREGGHQPSQQPSH